MTTIGKIESFDDTKENRETYVERVEQFFLANGFDDDHKVPSLLSLIGGKTYTLLRDLLSPEKPGLSLKTYTGENIMPVGVLKVPVDYQNQREVLDLYVVKNKASLAT